MLKASAVAHNGTCQIREIVLLEEAKWQFAQLLSECDSAALAFLIGSHIGNSVLKIMHSKDHYKNHNTDSCIQQNIRARHAV